MIDARGKPLAEALDMLPRLGGLSNTETARWSWTLLAACSRRRQSSVGEKLYVFVALGRFVMDHAVASLNSVGNRFAVLFSWGFPPVLVDLTPPNPCLRTST